MFERYAIYWSPGADSPLAAFGRDWFGGRSSEASELFGLDADFVKRATISPRRYGLHATIKAPFRLAEGRTEAELLRALGAFCARRRQIRAGPLRLHRFPSYLALTLASGQAEVDWLADECVTHFDRFRAPLSDADRARRAGHLSAEGQQNLEQFGYPDIFSRFLFHITLAGPLAAEELDRVEAAIRHALMALTEVPFQMDDLCLFGDPGNGGIFQLLGRFPLKL